jgi:glycosyltransferase involved in cell wall biosynthesis
MRYAWNQYFAYFSPDRLGWLSRRLIPPVLHRLRVWDTVSCHRVDHFAADSEAVASRIRRYYGRSSDVVHPPVDTDFFQPGDTKGGDYFLIVSALVPYKRIDLAVEAFRGRKESLKIVGQGPEFSKLRRSAPDNVHFLGPVGDEELRAAYQGAGALIMPGEEDFGINSLESQACGVPVIAFGRGGARETVVEGETGLFFEELSDSSLGAALDKFQAMAFNKHEIRANAERFARPVFRAKMAAYIQDKWSESQRRQ